IAEPHLMKHNRAVGSLLRSAIYLVLAFTACSPVDSGPRESLSTAQRASCPDGSLPGCDPCVPDSSSPTGGSRTCWNCDYEFRTESCYVQCGRWTDRCCAGDVCTDGSYCRDGYCVRDCGQEGQECCPLSFCINPALQCRDGR